MPNVVSATLPGSTWAAAPMGDDINQRIAEALMMQSFKPQQIQSHSQGLAEMANSALAGMMYRKALDQRMGVAEAMGAAAFPGATPPQAPSTPFGGGILGGISKLFGGGDSNSPTVPPPPVQTASIPPQTATDAAPPPPAPAGEAVKANIAKALADKQSPRPPADIPNVPQGAPSPDSLNPTPLAAQTPPLSGGSFPQGGMDPQHVQQIKQFEGFAPTAHWDYKQYTNGYGTKAAGPNETIDRATADQRYKAALDSAYSFVNGVAPNAPQGVKDALASLTFNAGNGWANSGLGQLVKAGDWNGAQQRLLQYNKAGGQVNPGLVDRRQAEAAWFKDPGKPNIPPELLGPPTQMASAFASPDVASNNPNFVPQQPGQLAPMGNPQINTIPVNPQLSPQGAPSPQVPVPPPRPTENPPGYFPMPPQNQPPFGGNQMPVGPAGPQAPPAPPAPPQQSAAPAPYQVAQNGPPVPPPQAPQAQPAAPQGAINPAMQMIDARLAQMQSAYQQMVQSGNPQGAMWIAQQANALQQQKMQLLMPEPLNLQPGQTAGMRVLDPKTGQYVYQPLAGTDANGSGMPNAHELDIMADMYRRTGQVPRMYGQLGGITAVEVQKRAAERAAANIPLDPASTSMASSQTQFTGLNKTMGDIMKSNNALNTGVGHLNDLATAFQNLGNGNFQPSNYVKNLLGPLWGATGPTNYATIANRVAPEITRIWRGTGGNEADIARDLETLKNSNTPAQGLQAIGHIMKLAESKMKANQYQYESVFGPHSADFMISPDNRAAIQRLEGLTSAGQGAQPQAPAIPQQQSPAQAPQAVPDRRALENELRRRGLIH